jgi:dihydrofolate reductase
VNGPRIALVAAVARNGVIGADDKLIWKLSTDMKRFRALTWGKPLVMGRKTYQSIGRPLPGRETVVVTRDSGFAGPGAHVAGDVDAALSRAAEIARAMGADEIIVAGGGEIYAQTIDRADRLFITEVDLAPAGDAVFPAIDPARWREVARERGARTDRDEAEFAFVDYVRRDR